MNREEVARLLLAAAHHLKAAAQLVMLEQDATRVVAEGRRLAAFATECAGDDCRHLLVTKQEA